MAEESGTNIKDPEQITWIIDPIDGTNNFITKYPYFCISIAGFSEGEIISGCILNPLNDELFLAVKGQGAYLNHKKYKVYPDMAMFGKAIGNGYAINAIIGKKKFMNGADKTFISSTFWTEAVGSTAALHTLDEIQRTKSWKKI